MLADVIRLTAYLPEHKVAPQWQRQGLMTKPDAPAFEQKSVRISVDFPLIDLVLANPALHGTPGMKVATRMHCNKLEE